MTRPRGRHDTGVDATAGTALWDIAVPQRDSAVSGLGMAGFRGRVDGGVELRIVPYPAVTLFVDFGDATIIDDASGHRTHGGGVVGLAPLKVRARAERLDCLQVRLSPVLAHAVLGASADLHGAVVSLADVWGRDAGRTQERLHAATSWTERFAIARQVVLDRRAEGPAADPEVVFAWSRMVADRGLIRVEGLADDLGWSRKRLWSRFRSQLGITPKRAASLIRFDHAVHQLAAGHSPARVAADNGYADQSHLHRDVHAFADATPARVAAAPWLDVDDIAWPATTSGHH